MYIVCTGRPRHIDIRQTGDNRRDHVAPTFDLGLKKRLGIERQDMHEYKKKEDVSPPPPLENVTYNFFTNNIYKFLKTGHTPSNSKTKFTLPSFRYTKC